MLVLSRLVNEEVIIGGVRMKIIDMGHGRVRLGFTGPRDVLICRGEVLHDRQEIVPLKRFMPNRKAG